MNQTELEEILEINEFIAYKMARRIETMNIFLVFLIIWREMELMLLQNMKIIS